MTELKNHINIDELFRDCGLEKTESLVNQFVWCECPGLLDVYLKEHYKDGWVIIPNSYLPYFLDSKTMTTVNYSNDRPRYSRPLDGGDGEPYKDCKSIFGFSNPDILDDYIKKENSYIDDYVENIANAYKPDLQYLSDDLPHHIYDDVAIVLHITRTIEDCYMYNLTERWMNVFTKSIDSLIDFVENNELIKNDREEITSTIDYGAQAANMCAIIRPYKLGEIFIPEKIRYNKFYDEY